MAGEVARGHRYDAVICLSAVIRGETPHFDYVAAEAAKGVAHAALRYRRSGGLRRAHHEYAGAGHRPRRRQGRQQGVRRRHVGHRNGQSPARSAPGASNALTPQVEAARAPDPLSVGCPAAAGDGGDRRLLRHALLRGAARARSLRRRPGARHGGASRGHRRAHRAATPSTGAWSACRRWIATCCASPFTR